MNEVMTRPEQTVSRQVVEDFLFSSGTKLNLQQKAMFMNLALQFGLNPFKREIYAVPYGQGFNYVTGYQVYIARAEATGKLDGWEVEAIRDNGKLVGAKAVIHRKDWDKPFIWEVSLSEFNRNMGGWKTMPEFMIKKVCMAQAFRLAFPNEFSGMPYIAEELGVDEASTQSTDIPVNQVNKPSSQSTPASTQSTDNNGDMLQSISNAFKELSKLVGRETVMATIANITDAKHPKDIPTELQQTVLKALQAKIVEVSQ